MYSKFLKFLLVRKFEERERMR